MSAPRDTTHLLLLLLLFSPCRWPVVRGQGAKIRFTKEQNSYDEQSYGYDNKYEQKYDDKYSNKDKEYYERREYHRER